MQDKDEGMPPVWLLDGNTQKKTQIQVRRAERQAELADEGSGDVLDT